MDGNINGRFLRRVFDGILQYVANCFGCPFGIMLKLHIFKIMQCNAHLLRRKTPLYSANAGKKGVPQREIFRRKRNRACFQTRHFKKGIHHPLQPVRAVFCPQQKFLGFLGRKVFLHEQRCIHTDACQWRFHLMRDIRNDSLHITLFNCALLCVRLQFLDETLHLMAKFALTGFSCYRGEIKMTLNRLIQHMVNLVKSLPYVSEAKKAPKQTDCNRRTNAANQHKVPS